MTSVLHHAGAHDCKSPQPAGVDSETRRLDELSLSVYLWPAGYPPVPADHRRSAANWLHGGVRDPAWVVDHIDRDVPMLIEQIRTRVLPKRGIVAARMRS